MYEAEKGNGFIRGFSYRQHEHSFCATFVSAACCLFSLPYTLIVHSGFGHITGDSVNFICLSALGWHCKDRHVPTFVYVLSFLVFTIGCPP